MQLTGVFPLRWALLWSVLIGAVYFLPQILHIYQARSTSILLEENYDEIVYAIWASRAAGEHEGQPDPYQLIVEHQPPMSFATAQPLPAFLLGSSAKLLRISAITVLWFGSFLFPTLIGFLFMLIAWVCGVREPWSLALCAAFSLLMLPPVLWLMQWRYVIALMDCTDPGYRLTLPYSRRFQPQFTAIIHYATIAFSLLTIIMKPGLLRRLSGLVAGVTFGLSFYCYYFSWTLLFGWFVLGSVFIWIWHRSVLKLWMVSFATGCFIAIPYFWLVVNHINEISASAASTHTYAIPRDPAILFTLAVCAVLAIIIWQDHRLRQLSWPLLTLNLSAVLGSLQNIATGIYIQPYHYLHYFARPTTNLALMAIITSFVCHYTADHRLLRILHLAMVSILVGVFLISIVFQSLRYREVSSLAQTAVIAQPALRALKSYAEPGAVVFCPQAIVREAIPLYTNAVSFFSLYMLLNENDKTHEVTYERIAGMQWLSGLSAEAFSDWLSYRPLEVNFQDLQRRIDEQAEDRQHKRAEALLSKFSTLQPEVFASLRYALLPRAISLETTRLPSLFEIKKLWSDEHYVLFAITIK